MSHDDNVEESTWRVVYSDGFARDLAKIDRTQARRILKYLATRIDGQPDPRQHGRGLTGAELGHLWRYRIGDYRVVADIHDHTLTVLAVNGRAPQHHLPLNPAYAANFRSQNEWKPTDNNPVSYSCANPLIG